jgi:hypothetical protein
MALPQQLFGGYRTNALAVTPFQLLFALFFPPLGPSVGVTELGGPIHPLRVSAQWSALPAYSLSKFDRAKTP